MAFMLTGSLSHVAWAAVRVRIPRRRAEGAVAGSHRNKASYSLAAIASLRASSVDAPHMA